MPRFVTLLLLLALATSACTPTLNWRDVRAVGALKGVLPCKPDEARRSQQLAGLSLTMHMMGCEAGGALFVIAAVALENPQQAMEVQGQWQQQMQTSMRARSVSAGDFKLRGAGVVFQPKLVLALGENEGKKALEVRSAWFVHGRYLYQAAVYAEKIQADMAEPFFSGLELP